MFTDGVQSSSVYKGDFKEEFLYDNLMKHVRDGIANPLLP